MKNIGLKAAFIAVSFIASSAHGAAARAAATGYTPSQKMSYAIEHSDLPGVKALATPTLLITRSGRRNKFPIQVAQFHYQSGRLPIQAAIVDYLKWPTLDAALAAHDVAAIDWLLRERIFTAADRTRGGDSLAGYLRRKGFITQADALEGRAAPAGYAAGGAARAATPLPAAGGARTAATTIQFYDRGQPYYEFTNFAEGYPFDLDGSRWLTSEHYFQAQKFNDKRIQAEIVAASTPRAVFDLANGKNGRYRASIRPDWHTPIIIGGKSTSVKEEAMRRALRAKFSNPALRKLLLDTGNARLVEASPHDSEWGGILPGSKNLLGLQLEELRAQLRGQTAAAPVAAVPAAAYPAQTMPAAAAAAAGSVGRFVPAASCSLGWTSEHDKLAAMFENVVDFDENQLLDAAINDAMYLKFRLHVDLLAKKNGKTLRDLADALDASPYFDDASKRPSMVWKDKWQTLRGLLTQ